MRWSCAVLCFTGALLVAASAQAEERTFIIANTDGYGVDRCLATGARCGTPIATAYCRSRQFEHALSFGRIEHATMAEAAAAKATAEFVAIQCVR